MDIHGQDEKKCITCGKPLCRGGFLNKCDRCRAIDSATSTLQKICKSNKGVLGYIGRNMCFDCGKPISSTEWYRTGQCTECQHKESARFLQSMEFRGSLLDGISPTGAELMKRRKHYASLGAWWTHKLPKSY